MRFNVRTAFVQRRKLPRMDRAQLDEVAAAGARAVARIILRRTKAGLDIDRRPFKPYSPSYVRQRREEGLPTKPELRRTGALLNSIQPKRRVVEVDGRKVRWLAEGGRVFFGIRDPSERKLVGAALRRKAKQVLR